ncbi:MAG: iron hydrogenase [Patescibacteria group bacterium]|nr:iron hydrogenase [Patescibacteria group bacterium]
MTQLKIRTLAKAQAIPLVQLITILALAGSAPFFLSQQITGPIVNALLFIATVILGVQGAVVVAFFPSVFALSVGLLPLPLAPMIPFVMVGNFILVTTFDYLRLKNFWLGIVVASLAKFLFLWASSSLIVSSLLSGQLAMTVSAMFSWPQLITALTGGILAYIFLKGIKRI